MPDETEKNLAEIQADREKVERNIARWIAIQAILDIQIFLQEKASKLQQEVEK